MKLETFFENFDLLTDAPNAATKLRELVLQLAVRGKLVEQDPEDEPADELLKAIKAYKDELVKNKQLRKERPLHPVDELDQPFELPSKWRWCRWNDISLCIGDVDHKMPGEIKDGIPYVSPRDFKENNQIDFERAKKISREDFEALRQKIQPTRGDIIFPRYGTIGENRLVETDLEFLASYSCAIIKNCIDFLEPKYSFLYSLSGLAKQEIEKYTNKTTQANVGVKSIKSFVFPLPPLAEQKRIVEACDRILTLCDKIDQQQQQRHDKLVKMNEVAIAKLLAAQTPDDFDTHWQRLWQNFDLLYSIPETIPKLRQAILQLAVQGKLVEQDPNDEPASALLKSIEVEHKELITQGLVKRRKPLPAISVDEAPFELPKLWSWARFPELGEFGRGKSKHRPRNDPKLYEDGKYPLVQTGDVARSNGVIQTHTNLYNDVGLAQSRLWPQGTLCITIAANIADSGLLGFDACTPDSVVGFVPSKKIGDARYFEFFMRTAKERLQDFAPSTAQKNINLAILEKVLIPLPPLAEQKRIVAKVDRLMALCDAMEAKLTAARAQRETLMEAAARQVLAV